MKKDVFYDQIWLYILIQRVWNKKQLVVQNLATFFWFHTITLLLSISLHCRETHITETDLIQIMPSTNRAGAKKKGNVSLVSCRIPPEKKNGSTLKPPCRAFVVKSVVQLALWFKGCRRLQQQILCWILRAAIISTAAGEFTSELAAGVTFTSDGWVGIRVPQKKTQIKTGY